MSEWRCIANNPASGVSTWAMDDGEHLHIQTRQDVSALLDENKAIKNLAQPGWKGDSLHSVARVPLSMLHDNNSSFGRAVLEGDDAYVTKVLNDGDFANLRTKEGRL